MKIIVFTGFILGMAGISNGRRLETKSYQEMFESSDLVAFAYPISSTETPEHTTLPNLTPPIKVVGVKTKFISTSVLKGDVNLKSFILFHYKESAEKGYRNGPHLVSFPIQGNHSHLLFLKKKDDGCFGPINGQTDPGTSGIEPADSINFVAIAIPISGKIKRGSATENALFIDGTKTSHEKVLDKYQTEYSVIKMIIGDSKVRNFVFQNYEYRATSGLGEFGTNFIPRPEFRYLLFLNVKSTGIENRICGPASYIDAALSYKFPIIELVK